MPVNIKETILPRLFTTYNLNTAAGRGRRPWATTRWIFALLGEGALDTRWTESVSSRWTRQRRAFAPSGPRHPPFAHGPAAPAIRPSQFSSSRARPCCERNLSMDPILTPDTTSPASTIPESVEKSEMQVLILCFVQESVLACLRLCCQFRFQICYQFNDAGPGNKNASGFWR